MDEGVHATWKPCMGSDERDACMFADKSCMHGICTAL